jgi:hypothetical protein
MALATDLSTWMTLALLKVRPVPAFEIATMTHGVHLSRRSLVIAAAVAAGSLRARPAGATQPSSAHSSDYVLSSILLDTGYAREDGEVVRTLTKKAAIFARRGRIAAVVPEGGMLPASLVVKDGGGLLLLPSFRDMNIHLDKTFYPGPWVPPRKRKNGIPGQIRMEQVLFAPDAS